MLPIEVAPDPAALADLAAGRIVEAARAAVAERGRFLVALSGGATPVPLFAELATRDIPWRRVHVFQVDERVAPPGDPERNLTALAEHLLSRVPIPADNVHPIPVEDPDLARAARAYAGELAELAEPAGAGGDGGGLDLVHLGLGDDGHTASWPPGDAVVDVAGDVAVVGPYRGRLRLSLTPAAVNRARRVLWLVDGSDKAPVLARLLAGDPAIPASRVRRDRAVVVAGDGAVAGLAGRFGFGP